MNITEISQLIAAADVCGHVPLIKGVHGLGKSESAAQYAKANDMHYEPLILSLMDTGDMLGIPHTIDVGGMTSTVWAAPSWYTNIVNAAWPNTLKMDRLQFADNKFEEYVLNSDHTHTISRGQLNDLYCQYYNVPNDTLQVLRQDNVEYLDSRRSVLFLDEFNRALTDILNASLQLILDHRLHSHVLPRVRGQETLIIAAINPADGDYSVQEFDPALLDRFVDCEVTADFSSWLKWAKENNVNKIVRDFLIDNQNKFHFTPKDGSKGTSPRSWTRVAAYLDRLEDTPKDIMPYYLKGSLGSSVAAQFQVFYNSYGSGISTKDIEKAVRAEMAIRKKKGDKINPEIIASNIIEEMIEDVDAVRKLEFAETFIEKYIGKENVEEAMPMMVYLYALPVENLSAVLKSLQTDNTDHYAKLATFDKEANNKKLFMKLVSHLKAFK
jgi:hypothetical protein